jgi:hypothetical protein
MLVWLQVSATPVGLDVFRECVNQLLVLKRRPCW